MTIVKGKSTKLKGTPFIRINASVEAKSKTLLNPGAIKYKPSRDLPVIKNKLSNFLNHSIQFPVMSLNARLT
jgi:hypothetical protein